MLNCNPLIKKKIYIPFKYAKCRIWAHFRPLFEINNSLITDKDEHIAKNCITHLPF